MRARRGQWREACQPPTSRAALALTSAGAIDARSVAAAQRISAKLVSVREVLRFTCWARGSCESRFTGKTRGTGKGVVHGKGKGVVHGKGKGVAYGPMAAGHRKLLLTGEAGVSAITALGAGVVALAAVVVAATTVVSKKHRAPEHAQPGQPAAAKDVAKQLDPLV